MRKYIVTGPDEGRWPDCAMHMAMLDGWSIRPIVMESMEEAERRKAIAEADMAEVKLKRAVGEVAKALGDGIVRHLGGSKFEIVYQLELDPAKPGYNGKPQAKADTIADVYVHVFGNEYKASLSRVYAELLLSKLKGLRHDQYFDVTRMSEDLSLIVPPIVLTNALWGRRYEVHIKGNHIAIVKPHRDNGRTQHRGY